MTRVPLDSKFTGIVIIGFLLSIAFTLYGTIPLRYGFTLILFFVLMIIAAMRSIFPDEEP